MQSPERKKIRMGFPKTKSWELERDEEEEKEEGTESDVVISNQSEAKEQPTQKPRWKIKKKNYIHIYT